MPDSESTVRRTWTIPKDIYDEVAALAAQEDRPIQSQFIRLVREALAVRAIAAIDRERGEQPK